MHILSTRRRVLRRAAAPAAAVAAALAAAGLVAAAPARAAVPAPAAAPVRAATTVTPSGLLSDGAPACSADFTACTIVAKAGTSSVVGTGVPVWNWVRAAGDSVTGVNPVLVLKQGVPVTITVVNGLTSPAWPLSLSIPGSGLVPDLVGVASGGTKTYTFTPKVPGTFLYEAGHVLPGGAASPSTTLDVGPREVAMGLAGAVVVRPSTFDAGTPSTWTSLGAAGDNGDFNGGNAYPDSSFADEGALVLSEVDPAFAAAPATYDLRKFNGVYRLVNGRVWPYVPGIGAAPGDRVLLRYVNAGVLPHSMGVLNKRESVVAVDAHASDGAAVVADTLAPGQTEDAVVTLGTGETGSWPVYDASGELNTNGAAAVTGNKAVAFGGMMTLLGTSIPDPGPDVVGPKSTITSATSPVGSTGTLTVGVSVTDPTIVQGGVSVAPSGVDAAEVLIDGAVTGPWGSGTAVTLGGASGDATRTGSAPVDLSAISPLLSQGPHRVYVRARDTAGNVGVVTSKLVTVNASGAVVSGVTVTPSPANGSGDVTVTATADDTKAGGTVTGATIAVGTGTPQPMTLGAANAVTTSLTAVIPAATVAAASEGVLPLTIVVTDSGGVPSTTNASLVVDRTGPGVDSGTVTPSPNNGRLGSSVDATSVQVSASFTDPAVGATGKGSGVTAAEGFLMTSPAATCSFNVSPCANGTGFVFVATDGAWGSSTESGYGLIPLTQLATLASGSYPVYVHARDAAGNWGPLVAETLVLDTAPPAVTGLAAAPTGTVGQLRLTAGATDAVGVTAAEWWEGTGTHQPMTVGTATGGVSPLTATVAGLTAGSHTFAVRARDAVGNWSPTVTVTVTVDRTAPTASAAGFTQTGAGAGTLTVTGADANVVDAAEYSTSATTAAGAGTAMTATGTAGTTTTFTANLALAAGTYTYYVRVRDVWGNWSANQKVTFTVTQDVVFADTNGWAVPPWAASTAGNWSRSTTADLDGSGAGLLAGGGGPTAYGYLTTPAASTATNPATGRYAARFLLRPGSVTTGTGTLNWVTLWQVRSGTTVRASVQLQRATATSTGFSLRVVNGAGTASAPVQVSLASPTQVTTVNVLWNGTSPVTLTVNGGTPVTVASGAAAGSTVDNARLGRITLSGVNTGQSGQVQLDGYDARRWTTP